MASTNFINDSISDIDYLGYLPYIEAFEYLICNHNILMSLPVVFGIHGKWGVGKSTFMRLVKERLDLTGKFFTIELNPWEYSKENNFVSTFLAKLYKVVENDLCNDEKKQDGVILTLFKSILKPLKITSDFKLAKVEYDFSKLNFDSQKQIVDDFITENYALKESIRSILEEAEIFDTKKVVVFIDDLDRCSTDKVLEVIESIKLVLNSKNCIFFLGCDKEYIENALNVKYKDFLQFLTKESKVDDYYPNNNQNNLKNFSREYLEKIIQVPFHIPSLNEGSIMTFIDSILNHQKSYKKRNNVIEYNYFEEFKNALPQELVTKLSIEANINPRRIKRILNLIFLNYIFIRFKFSDDKNSQKSVDLDILSFLGFIRDVEQEYYKAFLSGNRCRSVFRDHFLQFKSNLKNSAEEDESIIRNEKHLQNVAINEYFKIFYDQVKLKTIDLLNKKLENISDYISVSNITTSELYKENNWGEVGEIKSEITNKKLSIFLNRLSGNEVAQDFVLWFFEKIFNSENYIMGLQKNIHLYKKTLHSDTSELDSNFLMRFEYNDKEHRFFIRFERGNNLSSILLSKFEGLEENWLFDNIKKQITINNETNLNEIQQIREFIEILLIK